MEKYHSEGPNGSMQSSTYEVRGSFKKLFFNPGLYDLETNQDRSIVFDTANPNIEHKLKAMDLNDKQHISTSHPSSGCKITSL